MLFFAAAALTSGAQQGAGLSVTSQKQSGAFPLVAGKRAVPIYVDAADAATKEGQGRAMTDYTQALKADALKGARLGIARDFMGQDEDVDWVMEASFDAMKKQGATFATIYTTYLPLTFDGGYNSTVGSTMASSQFSTTWGGKMRTGVPGSTTRHDYLRMALEDCATSNGYFMQATEAGEIEGSLEAMFKRYMTSVRLTK